MNKATIYVFTNILNGKQYIGKTESGFDKRLSQHITAVKYKTHNSVFHNAIRKYGIENFHIECLQVSRNLVNLWEKHLIKRWRSKVPNGYNLTDGGEGQCGYKHTDNTKKKISKIHKGNTYNVGRKHSKKVRKNMGPPKGRIPWNKGTKGILKNNKTSFKNGHVPWNRNKIHLPGSKSPMAKKIILIHRDGTEEYFGCIKDASIKHNINYTYLKLTLNGKYKQAKGFKCRYYEEK